MRKKRINEKSALSVKVDQGPLKFSPFCLASTLSAALSHRLILRQAAGRPAFVQSRPECGSVSTGSAG
jgi:hypothetical protein